MIELHTRKLVNNIFVGEYHTAFRGQGMTFADFREYVHGDDVRNISWTLSARSGKPYIKLYEEERELTLILAVDVSGSGDFGSNDFFKGEVIAHIAAILGFSAIKNNDQVGLLMFSDIVEHYVPPKKGRGHIHRILRDLLYFKATNRKTKISIGLEYLQGVLKKRATIFILSDFFDDGFGVRLKQVARKHDTTAIVVRDPTELDIPKIGLVDLQDAETGDIVTVDTSNFLFQRHYKETVKKRNLAREEELRKSAVDVINITVGKDYTQPLIEYFKKRARSG